MRDPFQIMSGGRLWGAGQFSCASRSRSQAPHLPRALPVAKHLPLQILNHSAAHLHSAGESTIKLNAEVQEAFDTFHGQRQHRNRGLYKDMAVSIRRIMNPYPVRLSVKASVREAAMVMRDEDIGAVVVEEEDGTFCGIVTDRDIVVRALASGRDGHTELGSICSTEVTTLSAEKTDEDAEKVMKEKSIRRLPVIENGRVVGIVSLGDLAIERDPTSVLAGISAAPANV